MVRVMKRPLQRHHNHNHNLLNAMGRFITFEGGEGAGKSTLIEKLADRLSSMGHQVLVTREPGGSELGHEIRHLLLHHSHKAICPMAELLLFLSDRAQHITEKILPALAQGGVVLCDRFNDSSVAYQGHGRGLGMKRVQDLCRLVCGDVTPDLTFYLDISPEIGLARSQARAKGNPVAGQLDRIEAEVLVFHQLVREGFRSIAAQEPNRFHIVDAHQSPETVFQETMQWIMMDRHGQ